MTPNQKHINQSIRTAIFCDTLPSKHNLRILTSIQCNWNDYLS
mgnify:CR=1 FL=1|jgi:hypothetical protein